MLAEMIDLPGRNEIFICGEPVSHSISCSLIPRSPSASIQGSGNDTIFQAFFMQFTFVGFNLVKKKEKKTQCD